MFKKPRFLFFPPERPIGQPSHLETRPSAMPENNNSQDASKQFMDAFGKIGE